MPGQTRFPWQPSPAARVGRQRARRVSPVPRMAPAAVRIPDPRLVELPLTFLNTGPQIFVHEGARQALERRFSLAFGGPVQLAVTDNLHRMVTHTRENGTLRVRVHMMFLGAPERVLDALVRYALSSDRQASLLLSEFIAANSYRIRASRAVSGPLRTKGKVHDLLAILADINKRYFGSSVSDVLVSWGRRTRPRGKQRGTIKLGSYSATERLIRLHPALDREWVPRYFVSYIVYHELLHHLVPAVSDGGRISLHSPAFTRREREYRLYERALEWERKHLGRLLRWH
jgi:hypothetical protein